MMTIGPGDAAVVINVASGRCRVFRDGRELDCIVPADIAARQKSSLAVGDRVLLDDASPPRLTEILPRRTVLSRPDPANPRRQRLIAANIDVVANVVSMKAPPLRPRLIDRFLIAIQRGGAAPLIVVNKIDLDRDLAPLRVYEELGIPVIPCSTKSGEGLDALRAALSGKMSALVGHSGVGKSSILNALDARLQLATGELHRRGTGRHTTSSSTLHDLGGGTLIIDTPGIREFGLWDLTPRALRESFPEFDDAAELCRFNDCTHLHEPACEVKERVESGALSKARYDTYVRLAEDLACEKRF
jgi:ribosome biogenesis GTPase